METKINKIAVIGNIAGGKTELSRRLADLHCLPITHVDALQFLPGMLIRPYKETIATLNEITDGQEKWLIDGFGPLDVLEKRLRLADRVVFIDFPIWRHYWWCTKRQLKNCWSPRKELPEGCNELTFEHTKKLFKTLWQIHKKMRPEMTRILNRQNIKDKVIFVRTLNEWNHIYKNGIKNDI